MIARRLSLILVAAVVVLTDVAPALAQDARLEAAKKEGKVVWYTSLVLPSAERVARLFETQYSSASCRSSRQTSRTRTSSTPPTPGTSCC